MDHKEPSSSRALLNGGTKDVKMEDGAEPAVRAIDAKPKYKSWKKKYIKMRIRFDQKTAELDRSRKLEEKARATAKRIAIQNDRILDFLIDINDSPQIPPEKRIDVVTSKSKPSTPPSGGPTPKTLRDLAEGVPHLSRHEMTQRHPDLAEEMVPFDAEAYPPSALSPDDIDDYLYAIDKRLASASGDDSVLDQLLPSLAPAAARDHLAEHQQRLSGGSSNATAGSTSNGKPAPSSSSSLQQQQQPPPAAWDTNTKALIRGYTWLRKYAPKTFLQDNEAASASAAGGAGGDDDADGDGHASGRSARKPRGGARGERGSRGGARTSAAAARRSIGGSNKNSAQGTSGGGSTASASHGTAAAAAADDADAWMDDDADYATPTGSTRGNKRKRAPGGAGRDGDDDGDRGYHPKSGAAGRPLKRKRKSDADAAAARRSKKDAAASTAAASQTAAADAAEVENTTVQAEEN